MQYVKSISHRKEVFSMHNLLRTHRLRILYFWFNIFNLPSLLILSATNIIIIHPVRFVPEKMQFERFWKTSKGDALWKIITKPWVISFFSQYPLHSEYSNLYWSHFTMAKITDPSQCCISLPFLFHHKALA